MSLLKDTTTVSLEKRVEILEKQMKEIRRVLGKPAGAEEKKKSDEVDDDYCRIS